MEKPINLEKINLNEFRLSFKRADVYYIPNFFSIDKADLYFKALTQSIEFEKKEREGRLTALHGSAGLYKYALNEAVPKPWTQELIQIKSSIEEAVQYEYDVCLLNYYRNGKEEFRFHSDREEIGNNVPIASLSLGAERKFYFKSKPGSINHSDNTEIESEEHCIVLKHGSLLIMGCGTHENYIHGLPCR